MKQKTYRKTAPGPDETDRGRRRILIGATATLGAIGLGALVDWKSVAFAGPDTANTPSNTGPVRLMMYDDHGQPLGEKTVSRVIKSAAQWKQQLSPQVYYVTRESGTESAFSGHYTKPAKPGFYRCVCCNNALYDADTQFHSGTGWPSFWQPIAAENVAEHKDHSFGMTRTAIACKRCNAHLGHVFNDGPPPTGLRYCMNSVALGFIATGTA